MQSTARQAAMRRAYLGDLFGYLSAEIIKFAGFLIVDRDRLARRRGITNARWQVLQAVEEDPQTISQLGRRLGLSRQGLRPVVSSLAKQFYVQLADNPDHERAKLIRLTKEGEKLLSKLNADQRELMLRLVDDTTQSELNDLLTKLRSLTSKFEKSNRIRRSNMRKH